MLHLRRRYVTAAVALIALASATASEAIAPDVSIDGAAVPIQAAEPVYRAPDLVSVYQTGEMTPAIRDAALAAAAQAGAPASVGRGFTISLTRVRRGGAVIQAAQGPGWAFPMSVTALPLDVVGAVMGRHIASPISQGAVVMGETSASLRGAKEGDTIDLLAANGSIKTFTIGLVAPDAEVGGTEIVMSLPQADQLGAIYTTRVLVYGQFSRSALDAALAAGGLTGNGKVRIRRSWDSFDPDLTLSMAETKLLLGEFDFYYAGLSNDGWTSMNAAWVAANLPAGRRSYPTGIVAKCHNAVHADLTAALQEVVDSGLGSLVDAGNTNTYGGCATGTVRFARITQNLGSISRHSWGQPIDMNTASNCQGCVPKMDCRIVRIFRAHNFAWGGNFLTPDGMHFEWVGEPRNAIQYPSKYCPNQPGGAIETLRPRIDNSATFFAGDGWALAGDE